MTGLRAEPLTPPLASPRGGVRLPAQLATPTATASRALFAPATSRRGVQETSASTGAGVGKSTLLHDTTSALDALALLLVVNVARRRCVATGAPCGDSFVAPVPPFPDPARWRGPWVVSSELSGSASPGSDADGRGDARPATGTLTVVAAAPTAAPSAVRVAFAASTAAIASGEDGDGIVLPRLRCPRPCASSSSAAMLQSSGAIPAPSTAVSACKRRAPTISLALLRRGRLPAPPGPPSSAPANVSGRAAAVEAECGLSALLSPSPWLENEPLASSAPSCMSMRRDGPDGGASDERRESA